LTAEISGIGDIAAILHLFLSLPGAGKSAKYLPGKIYKIYLQIFLRASIKQAKKSRIFSLAEAGAVHVASL
jgi:hypothetical protein